MKWTCDCDNPASVDMNERPLAQGLMHPLNPDIICHGCGKLIGRLVIRELTLVRCFSILNPDSVHLGIHEQLTLCNTTLYNHPAPDATKVTCETCLKLAKVVRALPESVLG